MHLLSEVPYQPDTSRVFDGMASDPWAVFLDSGRPGSEAGRYDILTSDPGTTLVTKGGFTEIRTAGENFGGHARTRSHCSGSRWEIVSPIG